MNSHHKTFFKEVCNNLDDLFMEQPTAEDMLYNTQKRLKKNENETHKPKPRKPKDTFFEEYFKGKK